VRGGLSTRRPAPSHGLQRLVHGLVLFEQVVDTALDLTGGAGAFKRSRMEQLFRDVRMGRFHPGNTLLAHELIGKLCLGVNPDEPPRWG